LGPRNLLLRINKERTIEKTEKGECEKGRILDKNKGN
jgi:hypothetical protein